MTRNSLSIYKKYKVDGNPSSFLKNQYVIHENKIFKFIYPISDPTKLDWTTVPEPTSNSYYWKQELVENIYTESSSPPNGIKLPGDRWRNLDTNRTYVWIKSGNKYIWVSS